MSKQAEHILQTVQFITDDSWQHIRIINQETCKNCQNAECLTACPSWVFKAGETKDRPIAVLYKQCIECGACRLICPNQNIDFSYPHGGFGVMYREG
jgi:ferredoxin like protein